MKTLMSRTVLLTFFVACIFFSACSQTNLLGDWQTKMVYIHSDNSTTTEQFILTFKSNGQVYKNQKLYGQYERRADKRIKFHSQNRELVFYCEFINKNELKGEGVHIPNDTLFAHWTAQRK